MQEWSQKRARLPWPPTWITKRKDILGAASTTWIKTKSYVQSKDILGISEKKTKSTITNPFDETFVSTILASETGSPDTTRAYLPTQAKTNGLASHKGDPSVSYDNIEQEGHKVESEEVNDDNDVNGDTTGRAQNMALTNTKEPSDGKKQLNQKRIYGTAEHVSVHNHITSDSSGESKFANAQNDSLLSSGKAVTDTETAATKTVYSNEIVSSSVKVFNHDTNIGNQAATENAITTSGGKETMAFGQEIANDKKNAAFTSTFKTISDKELISTKLPPTHAKKKEPQVITEETSGYTISMHSFKIEKEAQKDADPINDLLSTKKSIQMPTTSPFRSKEPYTGSLRPVKESVIFSSTHTHKAWSEITSVAPEKGSDQVLPTEIKYVERTSIAATASKILKSKEEDKRHIFQLNRTLSQNATDFNEDTTSKPLEVDHPFTGTVTEPNIETESAESSIRTITTTELYVSTIEIDNLRSKSSSQIGVATTGPSIRTFTDITSKLKRSSKKNTLSSLKPNVVTPRHVTEKQDISTNSEQTFKESSQTKAPLFDQNRNSFQSSREIDDKPTASRPSSHEAAMPSRKYLEKSTQRTNHQDEKLPFDNASLSKIAASPSGSEALTKASVSHFTSRPFVVTKSKSFIIQPVTESTENHEMFTTTPSASHLSSTRLATTGVEISTSENPRSDVRPSLKPNLIHARCKSQERVLFLKTHKTGSSTVTNVLNRYTDNNNLTMLLPRHMQLGTFYWPHRFRTIYAKIQRNSLPNVLANQARFNQKPMNEIFPRSTTKYITMLRDPITQWESSFNYFRFASLLNIKRPGVKDSIGYFLKHPPSIEWIVEKGRRRSALALLKNPQSFDLGFDNTENVDSATIKSFIKTVESNFDLVLIMEHFEESMTLLKRRMCWDIDDVAYFKSNERLDKDKKVELAEEHKQQIHEWNDMDAALYAYFYEKFWSDVEKEGPAFQKDLNQLKSRNSYYKKTCIAKPVATRTYQNGMLVKRFALRDDLSNRTRKICQSMLRSELDYELYFYKKQNESDSRARAPPLISSSKIPSGSCEPQKNILFLKTHKTGSSTVTNILNRYTDYHNLTMLLPRGKRTGTLYWPERFNQVFARVNQSRMPNVLANHARFNQKPMNQLFPRIKTKYITILRKPVFQWESSFNYFRLGTLLGLTRIGINDTIGYFLNNPPSIDWVKNATRRYPKFWFLKNPQAFDLGFDNRRDIDASTIHNFVKTVERNFDLVLIMEHFEESMTLLKRRMCWSLDDVTYFKSNERLDKDKRAHMAEKHEQKIRDWNSVDVALYSYFYKKFWADIRKEGTDFQQDLKELRSRNAFYKKTCIAKPVVTKTYQASVLVKGFALRKNLAKETAKFCQSMVRNELDYQEYFYVKQKESEPAKRKGRSESKLIRKKQKGSESTAKTNQLKPVILKKGTKPTNA